MSDTIVNIFTYEEFCNSIKSSYSNENEAYQNINALCVSLGMNEDESSSIKSVEILYIYTKCTHM